MRSVLQTANVGPDGSSKYVLRVVDNSTVEVVHAEIVDVRGRVIYDAPYMTESGARSAARALYREFARTGGDIAAVRAVTPHSLGNGTSCWKD